MCISELTFEPPTLSVTSEENRCCAVIILVYMALLVSHNALQETLSLWMCAQCIRPLLSCATQCLCWAMASTVTCWLKVRNTAGWDLYDMTIQVQADESFAEQK